MLQPAKYKNILQSYQENLCAKQPREGGGTQPSQISTQKDGKRRKNVREGRGCNFKGDGRKRKSVTLREK